jgi:hypothetical protein
MLSEQRRIHWANSISATMGFVIASNIAIIGYFIAAYIHEPSTHPGFY